MPLLSHFVESYKGELGMADKSSRMAEACNLAAQAMRDGNLTALDKTLNRDMPTLSPS